VLSIQKNLKTVKTLKSDNPKIYSCSFREQIFLLSMQSSRRRSKTIKKSGLLMQGQPDKTVKFMTLKLKFFSVC
jgi:hypothetical protein